MAISSITPNGTWSKITDSAARLIASCPATLQFLGVQDKAAALGGNMYLNVLPEPPAGQDAHTAAQFTAFFPYILIGPPGDDDAALQYVLKQAPNDFQPEGMIEIHFGRLPEEGAPWEDQERIFDNGWGSILDELGDHKLTPGNLGSFHTYHVVESGRMTLEDEENEPWGKQHLCIVRMAWGFSLGD